MTWEMKKEDYDLSSEELHKKYENDPMFWKDKYENMKNWKDRLENEHWCFPKYKTLFRDIVGYDNERLKPEEVSFVILDVSCDKKRRLPLLQELADEQTEYYQKFKNTDEEYSSLYSVLDDALNIGMNIVLGEGHITDEDLNYNDSDYYSHIGDDKKTGWQKQIEEWA